jgi:hypothetical protein
MADSQYFRAPRSNSFLASILRYLGQMDTFKETPIMRILSTRMHGIMDYLIGVLLLLAPNLLGFADNSAAAWIPRVLGIIILLQALMTRFEVGVMPVIPMSVHLMMDYGLGLFLAASPWLFGFSDNPANYWAPHVVVGLLIFGQALMTNHHGVTDEAAAKPSFR